MNNKLIPTRYDNPCPICSKTNGNCRTTQNGLILCMTFADSMDEYINDYKFIGNTKDGLWGKFIHNSDLNNHYTNEQKEQYQQSKQAQEKARLEQFKGSLPIDERDKNIREIVKHLGLSHEHRQILRDRGLNDEQIKAGYFATIKPFTELPDTINTRLAGIYIGRNGKPHIGSDYQQGILCPIFQDGLIIGYQIRRNSKENKYIWAVTGYKKMEKGDRPKISSHLPNGELPITVFNNPENKQGYLCDGNLKSFIASIKHNINIAGASGGNFLASKNQFLKIFNQGYDIYILDGGDILNRQVLKRLERLAYWVSHLESDNIRQLKFAWYGQVNKDGNDIDEIESFEYELLTIEELLELASKEQFKKKKLEQLNKVKIFNSDITINEKYIYDEIIKINLENKILAINSPMNTGKSFYLKQLTNQLSEKFILINNRRVLTNKSCNILNLEYINQEKTRIDVEEALIRATDSSFDYDNGIGIVIDSLLKLEETDYQDAVIMIDEANQVIESLFLSNTHIKTVRGRVIRLLSDICQKAKSIILCDANLSDHTVNFFSELSNLKTIKIKNEYQENNRPLFVYPTQEFIKSEIESSIADKEIITIVSDSAKELTGINDLIKDKGVKSVLLTQDNLADYPQLHRFLENNGVLIKEENLAVLLLSPVGQSGISLEIGNYFDRVYGLFFGVVGTETARQMLMRDRGKNERHIWIADRGIGYRTDYDPQKIRELEEFKTEQTIIGSQLFSKNNQSLEQSILEWAKAIIEGKDELRKISEKYCSELIAKNNIEKSDYKSILLDELIDEGYQVNELNDEDLPYDDFFHQDIKNQKIENLWSEAEGINDAPEISKGQAKLLEMADSLKQSERRKLKKFKIEQSLPEMKLDKEFIFYGVLKDRFKLINGINNYYLANNPEIASILEHNSLIYQFSQVDKGGIFWSYDLKARSCLSQIFTDLEVQKLIDSNETLSTNKINSLVQRFRWHRQKLKIFGIKFNRKTYSTKLFKKVLKLFGYTLELAGQSKDGQRLYRPIRETYYIDKYQNLDRWDDIYLAIEKRYLGLIKKELIIENQPKIHFDEKIAQSNTNHKLEPLTELPDTNEHFSGSVKDSNQDSVTDLDLSLEKVPKNEVKSENKPVNSDKQFLEVILNDLGKDYISQLTDFEFNLWCEKWLEAGISFEELFDLEAIRLAAATPFTEWLFKACRFLDSKGNQCEGIIRKIEQKGESFWFWVQDSLTGKSIPCLERMIDFP